MDTPFHQESVSRVNGPWSRIAVVYLEDSPFHMDVRLAPAEFGLVVEMEGSAPVLPPPTNEYGASLLGATDVLEDFAETLKYVGTPYWLRYFIIYPGYVPDSDRNVTTVVMPCGHPRGSHWHVVRYDVVTEEPLDDVTEQLGDHSRTSLGAILKDALLHTFPKRG